MSSLARLLVLLALFMLVLPAPLKASCCPDPAQATGQSEPAPPCHGHAEDDEAPLSADDGCAGDCCPCRAPVDLPVALSVPPAPMPLQVTDASAPMLSGAQRIPPLPPPIV
jgi:hypothetical protein